MNKKEKAPQGGEFEANNIESAINSLTDIRNALTSDLPIDSFITKWIEHNDDVPGLYVNLRKIYAEQIDFAISFLKSRS